MYIYIYIYIKYIKYIYIYIKSTLHKFAIRMYLELKCSFGTKKTTYTIEINHYLILLLIVIYIKIKYFLYANYMIHFKFSFLNNLAENCSCKYCIIKCFLCAFQSIQLNLCICNNSKNMH